MLTSAIIWVLVGSAILCVVLFDVLLLAWVFNTVKRLAFGKKENNPRV